MNGVTVDLAQPSEQVLTQIDEAGLYACDAYTAAAKTQSGLSYMDILEKGEKNKVVMYCDDRSLKSEKNQKLNTKHVIYYLKDGHYKTAQGIEGFVTSEDKEKLEGYSMVQPTICPNSLYVAYYVNGEMVSREDIAAYKFMYYKMMDGDVLNEERYEEYRETGLTFTQSKIMEVGKIYVNLFKG